MRAWLMDRPGAPASMRLAEVDSPWRTPADSRDQIEVLVRVEAVGLSAWDLGPRTRPGPGTPGLTGPAPRPGAAPGRAHPRIPGVDIAGRVVAVHADAATRRDRDWLIPAPGTRVALFQDVREQGGFAELVAVPPHALAVLPREIDPIAAAALPSAGLTALDAVERRLRQVGGQVVLVLGAASGVGSLAVQLAKLFGATVIATARADQADLVRERGALHVIDPGTEDLAREVRRIAPDGVHAVIDTVSAQSATWALGLLRHAGHLVSVAGRVDLSAIPERTLVPTLSEVAISAAYTAGGEAERLWLKWGLERVMTLVLEGHLQPPEIEVIGFDQIADGLARVAAGQVDGALVANLRWR